MARKKAIELTRIFHGTFEQHHIWHGITIIGKHLYAQLQHTVYARQFFTFAPFGDAT